MRCPFCQVQDTKVIDSRLSGEGGTIRRRRECVACSGRFTTYESIEMSFPRIVKRDNRRCHFSEDKLRNGMLKALEKRPVTEEQVARAIFHIKHRLHVSGEREVTSATLGEWLMDELRQLDPVAYVRFASVYLSFDNTDAFVDAIKNLKLIKYATEKTT